MYENGETVRTYTTPVGTIYESFAGPMLWGSISARKTSFVKKLEDYKVLQYVFELIWILNRITAGMKSGWN